MTHSFALPLTHAHDAPQTRLQGSRLVIARVIWVILVVLTLSGFVAMLPASYIQLQTVCTGLKCVLGQPSLVAVQSLQAYGLTVENYALFAIALIILVTVICVVVALVIFWRRSDDWMALLVALTLVMEGTTFVTYILMWRHSVWQIPAFIMSTVSWSTIFLSFSLFPDGRFVPRWTRWLVITWLGCNILAISFPFLFFFTLFSNLIWLILCACCMVAQIYRYKWVSNPIQRQQTKWIVYGTSLGITVVIALEIPIFLFPSFGLGTLYGLISWYGFILALIPFPLAICFAVLRSRLWDIDNIINRTLVYALLMLLLALAYLGSVVLLQYLFRAFIGEGSPLVVAASTLAITALFHPLRRHIQVFIDTCFYRRRYYAPHVLADFDATVRSCLYSCAEDNLETLTSTMQKIAEETLQPSQISLWLYALEATNEANKSMQESAHDLHVTSTLVWENQQETPQGHYMYISEKDLRGKKRHNRSGDIDILINRVLIYGVLTSVIVLAGICILEIQQQLAEVLSTQVSELFIIGSVLSLVLCFKSLRRSIQFFINRCFYPYKHQAEQRLDNFTATLRHEINVSGLSEGLLEVVSESMEPEWASLWINTPEPESNLPLYTRVLRQ